MTGTKILIGQIAVVFALIIGAVWLATQMTAEALGVQPALVLRRGRAGLQTLAALPVVVCL
mgnify:CR=1 FL=1